MSTTEKISATLPKPDLVFLGEYMARTGTTRSGALHDAVRALREGSLAADYRLADEEWYNDSASAALWENTVSDGLDEQL
ncbi:hypothetical protein [Microbacterium sp.]|uniref:hypothetical protein n=1 Tax=Microbacterium sp. TaxID=51671 RepID=UPI003C718311